MIDLHLHFDGSLPVQTVWEQAKKQKLDLPVKDIEELKEQLMISDECKSLNEYLEKFDLPLTVMQTEEGIIACAEALIKELIQEGMLYVEIRFAPQLHGRNGLSQEEVVKAAIAGVKKGCENQRMKAQLILCCMRGNENEEANIETVQLTKKYLGDIVCACDLAGAEAIFKTAEFESLFQLAKSLEVPYTIHAGEADGPDSMKSAIAFGAKRLGHGVRCIEDPELVETLIEKEIVLECCPVSNLHTKAVSSLEAHPILSLLEKGVKTTINTDNRTVSSTTIKREVEEIRHACHMTEEEEKMLYKNAVYASFQTLEEKEALWKLILEKY